jgi:pimeloyl-ACP methyl ester carboxylesterase
MRAPPDVAVRVLLRSHDFRPPPPHTLSTAADDLARLAAAVGPPELLLGHSMGGKVALQYAARAAASSSSSSSHSPHLAVWALDSVPGGASGDPHAVGAVLAAVGSLPSEVPSRAWLAEALKGRVPPATAAWLASSLEPLPGAPPTGPLRWVFHLEGALAMYDSYKGSECVARLRDAAFACVRACILFVR